MKNKYIREESKEEMVRTLDKALDGLDIVVEESAKAAKKVWKDTEETRMAATRKGLSIARRLLEKAEQKFVDKL